ncbi:hypothetical protein [Nocardioides sp. B-3]|nr:hypothetical protein [Nocardioides sp. B-3]
MRTGSPPTPPCPQLALYEMQYRFYREIPELIAGFAVTAAAPR